MTHIRLSILLFFIPLALQAQVYRCETSDGTIYSQMPCAENAERLQEYDPQLDPESSSSAEPSEAGSERQEVRQPTAMESFISTLERQREEQFRTIDAHIGGVRRQLTEEGDGAPDPETRLSLENELTQLLSERASINDQYVALINEASHRAASGEGLD